MKENIEAPRDSPMGEEETNRESASSVSGRQNQAAAREKGPSGQREGKNKKWERQEPGHREEADKQNRSLLRALQDAIKNLVNRTKMFIDRAIGRNRILKELNVAVSKNDKVGIIRTSPTEKEHGRNWRELLYHGFARRLLGRDAYMHAAKQEEERAKSAEPGTNRKPDERTGGMQTAEEKRPEQGEAKASSASQTRAERQKAEQKTELQEMTGKINSLHKMITDDLEDKYKNAADVKKDFLDHYCGHLSEKLSEIGNGAPVSVSHKREDGLRRILIADKPNEFGEYVSFMGASRIAIEIDNHLNVTRADGFIATKQHPGGRLSGTEIDLKETLGKYVIAVLAKSFREDYNTNKQSFNVASKKEFTNEILSVAANNQGHIQIDNISYAISATEGGYALTPEGHGNALYFTLNGPSLQEMSGSMEKIEKELEASAKTLAAMDAQLADTIRDRDNARHEIDALTQAAMAATANYQSLSAELKKLDKELGTPNLHPDRTLEIVERKKEIKPELNKAYSEKQRANSELNIATLNFTFDKHIEELNKRIEEQKTLVGSLEKTLEEASETYSVVSGEQSKLFNEIHAQHVEHVREDRDDIQNAFEQVLPGCRNDIGGPLNLLEVNQLLEESDGLSLSEALIKDGGPEQERPASNEEMEVEPELASEQEDRI